MSSSIVSVLVPNPNAADGRPAVVPTLTGSGAPTSTYPLPVSELLNGVQYSDITVPGSLYTLTNLVWSQVSGGGGGGSAVPVLVSTTTPVADPGGPIYYQFNNGTNVTFNVPDGSAGLQRCYRNATGVTGVITIKMAAGNTVDVNGANGSTAGQIVSGGALGDAICLVADAAHHWYAYIQGGTWLST